MQGEYGLGDQVASGSDLRRGQIVDPHDAVVEGNREASAIAMQVEIAGVVGQVQSMEGLSVVGAPEPESAAVAAAGPRHEAGGMKERSPRSPLEVGRAAQ